MNIDKALETEALDEQRAARARAHDEARVINAARAYRAAYEDRRDSSWRNLESTRSTLFVALAALDREGE